MKKISVFALASMIMFNGVAKADKVDAVNNLKSKIEVVKEACSDIKSNLDSIFGLSVATTVSSGLGTVAAGGALAVGIAKAETDEEYESLSELYKNYKSNPTEENKKKVLNSLKDIQEYFKNMQDVSALEKKSKTLGNVRTGLMVGATVTSAVSTGTSIGATLTATKLAEKMATCNKALKDLKSAKSSALAEDVEETETSVTKAGSILSACIGYDESNIETLKNLATANTIVSSIGTATAGAGTITSALANSKKVRNDDSEDGKKKEKNLNTASNILAGVTMGTSGASTALSAVQISKAKKDSEMAEKCESALAE